MIDNNEEENMFVHKQAHIKCTLSTNTWEHTNAYIYTFETTTKHVQKNQMSSVLLSTSIQRSPVIL